MIHYIKIRKGYVMMKKRLLILSLVFAMASASLAGYGVLPAPDRALSTAWAKEKKTDAKTSMQPVQQFGYQLMEQYLTQKNPVLSPVSAYVVLGMVGSGAKGATKKEFQKVLGTDMLSISENLMNTLPQKQDHMQLTIANSAWLDDEFVAKAPWLETVKKNLQSEVFQADLGTKATKNKINQWVSKRTNKLIPELLKNKLSKETRLALVNALYFQADWQQKFQYTTKDDFELEDGTKKTVDMMHATIHNCGYFKNDTSEGVVLPYKDSNFAFVAVKPSGTDKIRDWYASCTAEKLATWIDGSETKNVELSLPKFEIQCRLTLNDSLKKLGMKRVFDEKKADLSLLGTSKDEQNLYLSLVLQEAVIKVAEEGTEAAAATIGAVTAGTAFIQDMPVVRFDRSFLYMIMDMDTGVPVFMGIVDQP